MNSCNKSLKKKFFEILINSKVKGCQNIYYDKKAPKGHGIGQKIDFLGLSIFSNLNKNSLNITLVVNSADKNIAENERIFSYLEKNAHLLQKDITNKIVWERKPNTIRRVARITNNDFSYEKQSDWEDMINYIIQTSSSLKASTESTLQKY